VPAAASFDPMCLRQRGTFAFEPPEPVSRWKALRFTATEAGKWLWRRPTPLAAPRARYGPAAAAAFPSFHAHTFDPQPTTALGEVARRNGATLNDLLLRDQFLTILDWNRGCGIPDGRWLRVAMPVNLRARTDLQMPAANKMSYAFLTRRPRDCADPAALLRGIHQETEAIKRWRLGLTFLGGLSLAARVPGALRLGCSGSRCLATTMLSNLHDPSSYFRVRLPRDGRLLRIADVTLERILAAPLLRPLTRAGMVAVRYAGRLTICARCDPYTFDSEDCRRLLALYVARIEETLARGR